MARACLKVYIDDKCIRTFGGNKADVIKEVVKLKKLPREGIQDKFCIRDPNFKFRYSIIKVKRRNKVYRLLELQDDITEEELQDAMPSMQVVDSLYKHVYRIKKVINVELMFTSEGILSNDVKYSLEELTCGYVRSSIVNKFGKVKILKEILKRYNEIIREVPEC